MKCPVFTVPRRYANVGGSVIGGMPVSQQSRTMWGISRKGSRAVGTCVEFRYPECDVREYAFRRMCDSSFMPPTLEYLLGTVTSGHFK